MSKYRIEKDTIGEIEVNDKKYWGAQTQRSLKYFSITNEPMPLEVIKALTLIKRSAAKVNQKLSLLDTNKSNIIQQVSDEILDGTLNEHFPLSIWQTGSGTQSNMNVNEVISNRAIELLGGVKGSKDPIHPNDHVNMGQSSNDCFPTAMNISTILKYHNELSPIIDKLISTLFDKVNKFKDIIKIGRTHLQDATPLTLGQEFSGYYQQIVNVKMYINNAIDSLYSIAQGGTAVGTGLNTHKDFAKEIAKAIGDYTKLPFRSVDNKFTALASHDDLVNFSSSLVVLATALNKIANDTRLLACGPRAGFAEIIIPANEPGSSIMPGKVNPTQIEAITMICMQVIGNHQAVTLGGMQGHLELNIYKPLIISNILRSMDLLCKGITNFVDYCLIGIEPNYERINNLMESSLMLVTSLNKHIGYDNAAKIAKHAYNKNITLKEAALELNLLTEAQFDEWVNPKNMI